MAAKFELYKDEKGEFRWRLVASNGQAMASSGEGYKTKESGQTETITGTCSPIIGRRPDTGQEVRL